MSVEVQWTDTDPATGLKRFVSVDRFAGQWRFKVRPKRREDWRRVNTPGRDLWETLLEALERRVQRAEGITHEDLAAVRKTLAAMPAPDEPDEDR
jgi:hypothetical protein